MLDDEKIIPDGSETSDENISDKDIPLEDVQENANESVQDIDNQTGGDTLSEDNDDNKFYTYESKEFDGTDTNRKAADRSFFRKATATIGFAITFGIIAGVCIHLTGIFLDDEKEKTEISIGGENTTLSGAQALTTTPVLNEGIVATSNISEVANMVMPSVVSITQTSVESVGGWYGLTEQEVEGSGSGFIIKEDDENFYIATNNHVIEGAKKIEVTFADDSIATATLKGAVQSEDIAVVVVKKADLSEETLSKIKVVKIGDSDSVNVGETAIAIGNALGYGQSVTCGVISAKDREISVSSSDNTITITVIQTDAAINPGNSGGALLNEKGEVIGINSAKLASSQVEGMGYAIPITKILPILNDIIDKETLTEDEKGYLGILGATINAAQQEYYGLPEGVYISTVSDPGPAKDAGLLAGDIIVGINDIKISTMEDLSNQIKSFKVGTNVKIKYKRLENGEYKQSETTVTLESLPDELKTQSGDNNSQNINPGNNSGNNSGSNSGNNSDNNSGSNPDNNSGNNNGFYGQNPYYGYDDLYQYLDPFQDFPFTR